MNVGFIKDLYPDNFNEYDTDFWDNFIGKGTIYYRYLASLFDVYSNKLKYLVMVEQNNIIGIIVYGKVVHKNRYYIYLLAKKKGTHVKRVGESLIIYLQNYLKSGCFMLIDDSRIPNYYKNLGFKKSWGYVNCLFCEYQSYSYYKYF
tara:strand:- start:7493 stop:7933 length:441 start_codon:yes stop_codon:yes gene_type:complete